MLETTHTITEMGNAFDGLINRLDMAEERLSKLEHRSMDIHHTEKQR